MFLYTHTDVFLFDTSIANEAFSSFFSGILNSHLKTATARWNWPEKPSQAQQMGK